MYQPKRVLIDKPPMGHACSRCESTAEVVALEPWYDRGQFTPEGTILTIFLCADCLAEALGTATGFRFAKQLAHWRKMRQDAIDTRATKQ